MRLLFVCPIKLVENFDGGICRRGFRLVGFVIGPVGYGHGSEGRYRNEESGKKVEKK